MSSERVARTRRLSVGCSGSCSKPRPACWVSSSTTPKLRKPPVLTRTTIRTATSASRQALPPGLRLARQKRSPLATPWLGAAALGVVGIGLGFVLAGAPIQLVLGTIAALLAAGAAIYRPAFGLAILAFTYSYDLASFPRRVKLTTSLVLLAILAAVWLGPE